MTCEYLPLSPLTPLSTSPVGSGDRKLPPRRLVVAWICACTVYAIKRLTLSVFLSFLLSLSSLSVSGFSFFSVKPSPYSLALSVTLYKPIYIYLSVYIFSQTHLSLSHSPFLSLFLFFYFSPSSIRFSLSSSFRLSLCFSVCVYVVISNCV